MMKTKATLFPAKYRVRRGLFGKAVLQELLEVYDNSYTTNTHHEWIDVKYNMAPRALRSEIID